MPTDLNPADVVSRGASPDGEDKWNLFFNGPSYITKDVEEWPEVPANESTVGALEVGGRPQDVGSRPQDVIDCPQDVGNCLQDVGNRPQDVGNCPQDVDDHPQVGGRLMEVGGCSTEVRGRSMKIGGHSQEVDVGPTVAASESGHHGDTVVMKLAN